jgi:hypothetical protein
MLLAGRERPDVDVEALRAWRREQHEREIAQHPSRERLFYWVVVAILIAIGLGAATFFVWRLVTY